MPTYEYLCEHGHVTEHRCMPSDMPQEVTCTHPAVTVIPDIYYTDKPLEQSTFPCHKTARRAFLTPPTLWIVGQTHERVLDTPGAKANKAGYQHTHGDRPATRTTSGPGGMSRAEYKYDHPDAKWFKPDSSKGTAPGEST